MNKIKIIYVCLIIFLIVFIGLTFLKMRHQEEFKQKTVLAGEIHKGLLHLMFDLGHARKNSIQGVPADGQWYHRVVFYQTQQGFLTYLVKEGRMLRISSQKTMLIADHIDVLRLRRLKQTPDILEVQIEAQKDVSLISNLRIRLSH